MPITANPATLEGLLDWALAYIDSKLLQKWYHFDRAQQKRTEIQVKYMYIYVTCISLRFCAHRAGYKNGPSRVAQSCYSVMGDKPFLWSKPKFDPP